MLPATLLICLCLGFSAAAQTTVTCDPADNLQTVSAGDDCLALLSFGQDGMQAGGTLVVFLHGDVSKGGPSDSFRRIAEKMTAPGRMAVVLIRQGYYDSNNRQSTGRNYDRSDNATADNIDNIGLALAQLKSFHHAARLVVVGHSRGSNIAGVLIGRRPGLIDAAFLMSCPCDLETRQSIRNMQRSKSSSYRSLSPLDFTDGIPPSTWIATVTGSKDDNTAHGMLEAWHDALRKRNLPVRDLILDGEKHNWSTRWFDHPEFKSLLNEAIGG